MPRVEPFVGLLYDRSAVGSIDLVTARPYDIISEEDRRRYFTASPYNIARILLGEDRADEEGPDQKYRRAASELRRWREEGVLTATNRPSTFPYEMRFSLHGKERRVRGLICSVTIDGPAGAIVPHERTMTGPVEDRLLLTRAVRANLSCIYGLLRGPSPVLDEYLEGTAETAPAAEALDEDGVRHRLWVRSDARAVTEALTGEDLLIADGHHRYTMYLRYRAEMRARHGPGPWDRVMMLVVDSATEEPPVLPYHRILRRGEPPREGAPVRDLAELLAALDDEALRYGTVTVDGGGLVHRVAELEGEPPTVVALHRDRLRAAPGDLGYTPDPTRAEAAVRAGEAAIAYLLPPTLASRIREVVDRGERLPEKSTFFWPKPRTGMVMRPLDLDV